jgi:hypothetical protein
MDLTSVESFPFSQVGAIKESVGGPSWLVESLWLRSAAGICGGPAKSCKSWFCLELAVAVASGTPCLGQYRVEEPGPVLVFLAEDDPRAVRGRITGLCTKRNIDIAALPLQVITAPVLRLDDEKDRLRLMRTVEITRPRLLLLDPLVRLHRLDENSARDISGLLGFLREIQRTFDTAIILTHHASKKRRGRPGESLRGSSDLHAFVDSLVSLTRREGNITVTVEHRSAPAPKPFLMRLVATGDSAHLELEKKQAGLPTAGEEQRLLEWMGENSGFHSRTALRAALKINNQRLGVILQHLQDDAKLQRDSDGWSLAAQPHNMGVLT